MGLLDRLDELDYRLHLRRRPGTAARRPLTRRRIGILRAIWCAWLIFAVLAVIVAIVKGIWVLPIVALIPSTQWLLYDSDTRQQILPRRRAP